MFSTLDKQSFLYVVSRESRDMTTGQCSEDPLQAEVPVDGYLVYPAALVRKYQELGPVRGDLYRRALYTYYEQLISHCGDDVAADVMAAITQSDQCGGYVRPFLEYFLAKGDDASRDVPDAPSPGDPSVGYWIWRVIFGEEDVPGEGVTEQICEDIMDLIMEGTLVYAPEALARRLDILLDVL